jgi:Kdo2-lipid IVA lauroyltransferase/acyltransferase
MIRDAVPYALIRAFFWIVGRLPATAAYGLCGGLADLAWRLDRKHRRIGRINLNFAFPDESDEWKERVLRESFRQVGDHVVELSRLMRSGPQELARRVSYEEGKGVEHYRQAKQDAGSVLFVTAHISAWELLPAAHAVLAEPLSFLVRPLDNFYLDRWARKVRSRFGNRVIPKSGSLRRVLKSLREGRDVGFLIDQNVMEKDGVYAPLFGRPACTASAVAAIACNLRLPVIAGFILPEERKGFYKIRFYPPLEMEITDDRMRDLETNTARFNALLEEVIRERPDCWLWGHRRFRTQPDGSNPYGGL